ncbi:hypothetical protein pb186bvf_000428 [Paramecium bursaria]
MIFKRVKTEYCDKYELYKQTYAPRLLYRSPRQLVHYRPPSKQSKKEISVFTNTFELSLDLNIKKTPITHQPNIRDIFKYRPPLNQSQQQSRLISSKKHELLHNQKENSEICSNIKFQDSQFKQDGQFKSDRRSNKSQHFNESRRSTQKSQYVGKTPKYRVIEPKIYENSNIEDEVQKDFGQEMEIISRKVNEAIRTNPYNFLEVIAKQSTEQKERQQRVNELMKMRMEQKQQIKTQSFESELKARDSLLGPEVIESIKKITNDSIFKKSIKQYNKTFQTQSIFDNASKDNLEDLIGDLNQMTISESSKDQSNTTNLSQIDSKSQTEPAKPKQKGKQKQRVTKKKRASNGQKKKKTTKQPYVSFKSKQKTQTQYCSKTIKQQKTRLNDVHTYEQMSVVDKQIRGLHLDPLPKYNVAWNRLHQRQIARRQNPLFRTEEWRRITDLLPNFYPLNSEAYNCRIRIENPLQWKSRACLTLTVVSQACFGPVTVRGTIQVALAKKFSQQQQEEIKERFFFDGNYSKSFLPGCFKDGMSLQIKNKFLVINGTSYDIPIRIIIETRNRNVLKRR